MSPAYSHETQMSQLWNCSACSAVFICFVPANTVGLLSAQELLLWFVECMQLIRHG